MTEENASIEKVYICDSRPMFTIFSKPDPEGLRYVTHFTWDGTCWKEDRAGRFHFEEKP